MTLRGSHLNPIFTRSAQTGAAALVAAIALLGATAPAQAEVAASSRVRIPAGAWVMTQAADGHIAVVTGRAALEVATKAADGTPGPKVLSVQPDQAVHSLELAGHENDPMRSQQWALDKTSFESAWSLTRGHGVKVAVIDSGVEVNHQELTGSVLRGKDYIDPSSEGRIDPDGHGTHVAGIIAAHINNAVGIDGAAPGVQILPVRVLDATGSGNASNVAKGIIWATDHGARVINLSLGGGKSAGLQQAMQYANSKQVVVLAAGGNNAQAGNAPMYPAAYPQAIAVASVDDNLAHSAFSNTGRYLDISAPGEGIVSTWGTSTTSYADASGTSMATPYAAAEAALIFSTTPKLSAARVKLIMQATATHLGSSSVFGQGLVNPVAAVLTARAYRATAHPTHAQIQRQSSRFYFAQWVQGLNA
jgi:type VII secretion-associated serine protease mycosin